MYVTSSNTWYDNAPLYTVAILYTQPCPDKMILNLLDHLTNNTKKPWKVVVFIENLPFSTPINVIKKYCQHYIDDGTLQIMQPKNIACSTMDNYLDCTISSRWKLVNALSMFSSLVKFSEQIIFMDQCFSIEQTFVKDVETFVESVKTDSWISLELYPYDMTGTLMRASDIEQFIGYALQELSQKPEDSLSVGEVMAGYVDTIHPPCGQVVNGSCLQELGLSRILHHPSLLNVTSDTEQVDTNHVIRFEAWPWMDSPIYINPPCTYTVYTG